MNMANLQGGDYNLGQHFPNFFESRPFFIFEDRLMRLLFYGTCFETRVQSIKLHHSSVEFLWEHGLDVDGREGGGEGHQEGAKRRVWAHTESRGERGLQEKAGSKGQWALQGGGGSTRRKPEREQRESPRLRIRSRMGQG